MTPRQYIAITLVAGAIFMLCLVNIGCCLFYQVTPEATPLVDNAKLKLSEIIKEKCALEKAPIDRRTEMFIAKLLRVLCEEKESIEILSNCHQAVKQLFSKTEEPYFKRAVLVNLKTSLMLYEYTKDKQYLDDAEVALDTLNHSLSTYDNKSDLELQTDLFWESSYYGALYVLHRQGCQRLWGFKEG